MIHLLYIVRLKFARDKEKQHESELDYDIPPKVDVFAVYIYQISYLKQREKSNPLAC